MNAKYWDNLPLYHTYPKLCTSLFYYLLNIAGYVANSVDPDQMLHSAASDQGLYCLLMPIYPSASSYYIQ